MTKKNRTGVIYMATVNGKSYIGQSVDFETRKKEHLVSVRKGSETHFHRAIRKHGMHEISWDILEDSIPEDKLNELEKYWIAFYDTYHNGYNMTLGGESSPMLNPEVASRASAVRKAQTARGEHSSQRLDVRLKISETLKAQAARGENPMQNPEIAAKASATHKAKAARGEHTSQQPEVRAKMSATQKAKSARGENPMQNPEIVAKSSKTHKYKYAEIRLRNRREAGQTFLLDMELDDEK